MTPNEKLTAFTKTIITLNYKNHNLFNTFMNEWEYKISTNTNTIDELYLFNKEQDIIITHKFKDDLPRKYFDYFIRIGIIEY